MNNEESTTTVPIFTQSFRQPVTQNSWLPYILMFISTIIQAFSTFYAKYIIQHTSPYYNVITFLFYRSISVVIGSYLVFKIQKEPLLKPKEIPHRKWFLLRANLSFFSLVFFIISLHYLRCSTTQVILTITPMTALFFSILLFHEKLSNSFLIGIFICTTAVILVIINEFDGENTSFIIQGLMYSFVSVLIFGIVVLSNKKVSLNQISMNTHNFYQGLTTMVYSILYILLTFSFKTSLKYFIMCFLHGVFFVIGQALLYQASRSDSLSKINRLNYFQIIYVFILCYIFLGEEIYFTDIVGCIFIISFLLYNSINPS